jgi:hypothetical protein
LTRFLDRFNPHLPLGGFRDNPLVTQPVIGNAFRYLGNRVREILRALVSAHKGRPNPNPFKRLGRFHGLFLAFTRPRHITEKQGAFILETKRRRRPTDTRPGRWNHPLTPTVAEIVPPVMAVATLARINLKAALDITTGVNTVFAVAVETADPAFTQFVPSKLVCA